MLTLLIPALGALVVYLLAQRYSDTYSEVRFFAPFLTPMLMFFALWGLYSTSDSAEDRYIGSNELVAAGDGTSISGSIFVFHTEDRYVFYAQEADGGIHRGSVPSRHTVIYEDAEPDTARLDHIQNVQWDWFWFPTETRYTLHVPPGSVSETFNFDLE